MKVTISLNWCSYLIHFRCTSQKPSGKTCLIHLESKEHIKISNKRVTGSIAPNKPWTYYNKLSFVNDCFASKQTISCIQIPSTSIQYRVKPLFKRYFIFDDTDSNCIQVVEEAIAKDPDPGLINFVLCLNKKINWKVYVVYCFIIFKRSSNAGLNCNRELPIPVVKIIIQWGLCLMRCISNDHAI